MIRTAAIVLALSLLSACTTPSDVVNAKGEGKTVVYEKKYDEVWNAAALSVYDLRLNILVNDKKTGKIIAMRGAGGFTAGENVAVFVEQITPEKTSVEVVSKKALATNITARDWTNHIFAQLNTKLNSDETDPKMKNMLIRYKPVIDTKGVNFEKYQDDLYECNKYAMQATSAGEGLVQGAIGSAATGAAIAAASGAGGVAGNVAGGSAVGGAVAGAAIAENERMNIVRRCLVGRGYMVIG